MIRARARGICERTWEDRARKIGRFATVGFVHDTSTTGDYKVPHKAVLTYFLLDTREHRSSYLVVPSVKFIAIVHHN